MVSDMGKQPKITQFHWARPRSGYYTTTVDGIEYTAVRIGSHRWELTGTIGPSKYVTVSTIATTAHEARSYARRSHAATVQRLAPHTPTGPAPAAAIVSTAVLAALRLRNASVTLTAERRGFYAHYSTQPTSGSWTRLVAFKPTAAEALSHVDIQVRAALAPGGALHSEMLERAR